MPFMRAPSCATGPLFDRIYGSTCRTGRLKAGAPLAPSRIQRAVILGRVDVAQAARIGDRYVEDLRFPRPNDSLGALFERCRAQRRKERAVVEDRVPMG